MNNLFTFNDTIAAISTAQGASGIGIVRLSGKEALEIVDKIFLPKDMAKPSDFKSYTLHYGWIVAGCRRKPNIIDEVLLTVMRAPKSYTREDVVEINCHGGIVSLRSILELVLANGARLAAPGEFTKRAFLNGRIDLAQAEAVLDIIQSKTEASLRLSNEQLKGALSDGLNNIRKSILDILSLLEVSIDFGEEEDATKTKNGRLTSRIRSINNQLKQVLDSASIGRLLREGVSVVICGRPNVGKSSLLNALLKEERVIVTPIAGTTRDIIEETLDIRGIPVKIADTAGIIEPRDLAEHEAVNRARRYFGKADLIVLVFDASKSLTKQDKILIRKINSRPAIAVLNKIDLPLKIKKADLKPYFKKIVELSALKLKGIGALEKALLDMVLGGRPIEAEPAMISSLRQKDCIVRAFNFCAEALNLAKCGWSQELIAESLKGAICSLDEITGRKVSDDLLDKIFSEFCVGK